MLARGQLGEPRGEVLVSSCQLLLGRTVRVLKREVEFVAADKQVRDRLSDGDAPPPRPLSSGQPKNSRMRRNPRRGRRIYTMPRLRRRTAEVQHLSQNMCTHDMKALASN